MEGKLEIHQKASFLSDAVFAASDGIITTFAIIAGSAGASLSSNIVLILGFANLFADGFSMAAGNYLGVKSGIDYEEAEGKNSKHEGSPLKHGLITFISFNVAGFVPLIPFVLRLDIQVGYYVSTALVFITLYCVGVLRSLYTKKGYLRSGVEMIAVGGIAALLAFGLGYLVQTYIL